MALNDILDRLFQFRIPDEEHPDVWYDEYGTPHYGQRPAEWERRQRDDPIEKIVASFAETLAAVNRATQGARESVLQPPTPTFEPTRRSLQQGFAENEEARLYPGTDVPRTPLDRKIGHLQVLRKATPAEEAGRRSDRLLQILDRVLSGLMTTEQLRRSAPDIAQEAYQGITSYQPSNASQFLQPGSSLEQNLMTMLEAIPPTQASRVVTRMPTVLRVLEELSGTPITELDRGVARGAAQTETLAGRLEELIGKSKSPYTFKLPKDTPPISPSTDILQHRYDQWKVGKISEAEYTDDFIEYWSGEGVPDDEIMMGIARGALERPPKTTYIGEPQKETRSVPSLLKRLQKTIDDLPSGERGSLDLSLNDNLMQAQRALDQIFDAPAGGLTKVEFLRQLDELAAAGIDVANARRIVNNISPNETARINKLGIEALEDIMDKDGNIRPEVIGRASSKPATARPTREPLTSEKAKFKAAYMKQIRLVQKAEKTPTRQMTPEEIEAMTNDWKAYSRARGYTEKEIADYQKFIDMYEEGQKLGYTTDELQEMDLIARRPGKRQVPVDLPAEAPTRPGVTEPSAPTPRPTPRVRIKNESVTQRFEPFFKAIREAATDEEADTAINELTEAANTALRSGIISKTGYDTLLNSAPTERLVRPPVTNTSGRPVGIGGRGQPVGNRLKPSLFRMMSEEFKQALSSKTLTDLSDQEVKQLNYELIRASSKSTSQFDMDRALTWLNKVLPEEAKRRKITLPTTLDELTNAAVKKVEVLPQQSAAERQRIIDQALEGRRKATDEEAMGGLSKERPTVAPPPPVQKYPGVTSEASELLSKLDEGSAAMDSLTNNAKRILRENGFTPAQYNKWSAPEAFEHLRAKATVAPKASVTRKGAKAPPKTKPVQIDETHNVNIPEDTTPKQAAEQLIDEAEEIADEVAQEQRQTHSPINAAKPKPMTLAELRARHQTIRITHERGSDGRWTATAYLRNGNTQSATDKRPGIAHKKLSDLLDQRRRPTPTGGGQVPPSEPPKAPPKQPEYADGGNLGDDIKQLMEAIKKARRARVETSKMRSEELSKRVGSAERAAAKAETSVDALTARRGAMKGALPEEGLDLGMQFTTDQRERFAAAINTADVTTFDKIHAESGLRKLIGLPGDPSATMHLPQQSELNILEDIFGSDLIDTIIDVGKKNKLMQLASTTLTLPTALMSSWDLSWPLRQGAMVLAHSPKTWGKMWEPMLRSFASEDAARQVMNELKQDHNYERMMNAGLEILDWEAHRAGRRTEEFMGANVAEKIPLYGSGIGKQRFGGIRGSNRAFAVAGNFSRVKMMSQVLDNWNGTSKTVQDEAALAHFFNVMTGRGTFAQHFKGKGGAKGLLAELDSLAPVLNAVFFAPKFAISRPQLLWMLADPRTNSHVRKILAWDLIKFSLFNASLLLAMDQAGADVEVDPRSSDFGKIIIGSTRVDFLGGFQPPVRAFFQLISPPIEAAINPGKSYVSMTKIAQGHRKTLGTGEIVPTDWMDIFGGYLRAKLSPSFSLGTDIVTRKKFSGDEFELTPTSIEDALIERTVPMWINDIREAAAAEWINGRLAADYERKPINPMSVSFLGFIGGGINTFRTAERDVPGLKEYKSIPELVARHLYPDDEKMREAAIIYMRGFTVKGLEDAQERAEETIGLAENGQETMKVLRAIANPSGGLRAYMVGRLPQLKSYLQIHDNAYLDDSPIEEPSPPNRDMPYTKEGKVSGKSWTVSETKNYWANYYGKKWGVEPKDKVVEDTVLYADLPPYMQLALDKWIDSLDKATARSGALKGLTKWHQLTYTGKKNVHKAVGPLGKPEKKIANMTPKEIIEQIYSELDFAVKPKVGG